MTIIFEMSQNGNETFSHLTNNRNATATERGTNKKKNKLPCIYYQQWPI